MDYLVYIRLSENNSYTVPRSATKNPYVFVSKQNITGVIILSPILSPKINLKLLLTRA